jgi:hypothetical protein
MLNMEMKSWKLFVTYVHIIKLPVFRLFDETEESIFEVVVPMMEFPPLLMSVVTWI